MPPELIWNAVLTAALAIGGWIFRGYVDEQKRISILLNKTREEMARDYMSKTDVQASVNMLVARIDRLDQKIDQILQGLVK